MSLIVGEHPVPMTLILVQGSTADLVVPAVPGVLGAPVLEFTQNRAGAASVTHSLALESGEWVAHLTVAQVAALAGLNNARVKDAGRVVAAGMVQHNSGWDGRAGAHVTVDRLVWGGGAGGGGGDGADPLAALTTLPASPVAWLPYQFRLTAGQALPAGITWATGAPVIGGWGIAVLIWDGTTWRGEWAEMTGGGSTPPGGAVTPMEPTFTDPSGTASDRYTIPSQTGVEYRKAGTPISAGTYTPTAGETVTITAHAATGYTLTSGATASWTHTFSTVVANTAPSMTLGTPTITGLQVSQPFTTTDVDGNPVTVTATWGDGATGTVTSPAVHTYAAAGAYSATFTPNDGTVNGTVRSTTYTFATAIPPVGTPATLQQALLDYGALGYWKLTETSGTTMSDSSGNGRHLPLAGTPTTDYELAGKDGRLHLKTASAIAGDLTGTALSVPAGGHLTVFALVHMLNASGGAVRRLVSKRGSANQAEWGLVINASVPQSMVWRANPSVMLSYSNSTVSLPPNDWNAVATVIPRDTEQRPVIYINSGTPVSVTSGSTGLGTTGDGTDPFRIGGGWIGGVGHVAVMPHNLTDAHIQKLVDLARAEGMIP